MQRLIVFALSALATLIGASNTDPASWFGETAVLAGVVGLTVAFLRKSLSIDGIVVVITSLVVGVGLAGAGFAAGLFAAGATLVEALSFGLAAGWLASGGVDFLRGVLGKRTAPSGA